MPAEFVFHYGEGSTHTLAYESWNITRSRSNGLTWSVVLTKPIYWPGGAIGANFEPYERSEGALASWVECTLTKGADTWTSPKLAILDIAEDNSAENLVIEISGSDMFSEMLLYEGITIGDRRSTSSTVYTCKGLLQEVATACGLGTLGLSGLTDYNVPMAHLVGQGLSLFRELLELTQGWLLPGASALAVLDGGIDPDDGSADFSLSESNSKAVQRRKRSTGIYNQATFERVSEHRQLYGPVVENFFGNKTVTLAAPAHEATLVVFPYGEGTPENGTWDDASDNPLTTGSTFTYRGSTPAAKVRFSLTPSVAWGENPMPALIEVRGKVNVDEVSAFEEAYEATYNDTADQAVRGVLPFPEPFTSGYCPDQATALLAAELKVKETLLSYLALNVDGTMNLNHHPGLKASCTYPKLAMSSKRFLVESVAWSGDANEEIESLELARGAA